MPDQDENIQMEKISLNDSDFASDLENNGFGIQDSQVLASNDLKNFLLSDPDEIKNVADEKAKEAAEEEKRKQQQSQETPEEKSKREASTRKKEEEKPDGKKALENLLFNEKDENDDEEHEDANKTDSRTPNGEDDTYSTLSTDLLRLGVFSKSSEEETEDTIKEAIKTPEQFLERFALEKKKGAINILDNFLSQFGEEYRQMFDAVFVNGVKPQDYVQTFAKIEAIKDLDLAVEANQEKVLRSYFKGLKMDDAKIDARIQKSKDYGDLEEEAKTYHEVLITKEKENAENLEKTKADERLREKEKEASTQKSIQRIINEKLKAQEIDGIPLTQKDAEEIFAYLVNKPYKLATGELLSEFDKDIMELNRPENHEQKIKLGLLLKKKLDLTSIKKTTISKKSDALFTLSTKNAKQSSKEEKVKSFF